MNIREHRKQWLAECRLEEGDLSAYSKKALWEFLTRCMQTDADDQKMYKTSTPPEFRAYVKGILPADVFAPLKQERAVANRRARLRGVLHRLPARNGCTAFVADALTDQDVLGCQATAGTERRCIHRLITLLSQWTDDGTYRRAKVLGALISFAHGDVLNIPKEHRAWFRDEVRHLTGLRDAAATPSNIMAKLLGADGICRQRRGMVFIDDKRENLDGVGPQCPCIFPILCNRGETIRNIAQWRAFTSNLGKEGNEAAKAMLAWLQRKNSAVQFDRKAVLGGGIDARIATRVTTALEKNELRAAILDWDRTVTSHKGNLPLPGCHPEGGEGDAEERDVAAVATALSSCSRAPVTEAGVVSYYLGGTARVQMMRRLIRAAQDHTREILILTKSTHTEFITSVMEHLQASDMPSTFAVLSVWDFDGEDEETSKLGILKTLQGVCDEHAGEFPCMIPTRIQPLIYGNWKALPRT